MDHSQELAAVNGDVDERPTATFILFAYNQENFIREAVEGAFAQTYEPLEIVLSDDCSIDRTFEIMREMASDYDGPHIVKVVQTPTNLGLIAHILKRGREAAGEVIVVAAGDDISEPERTSKVVGAFVADFEVGAVGSCVSDSDERGKPFDGRRLNLVADRSVPRDGMGFRVSPAAVFSAVSIIDEYGNIVAPIADRPLHLAKPKIALLPKSREFDVIQGCSAAYAKWVFQIPVNPVGKKYPEDLLFSYYLNLLGASIVRLEMPLVRYRAHSDAQSNRLKSVSGAEDEVRLRRVAEGSMQLLDEFQMIARSIGKTDMIDMNLVEHRRMHGQDILEWPNLTVWHRLRRILRFRPGNGFASTRWKLVRLWGEYPEYQPKMLISRWRQRYR